MSKTDRGQGLVYIVGAGPGDPGLITVKGLKCIEEADVIIYDRLIADSLLSFAPASSEKIYVGKEAGKHTLQQDEINKLLAARAEKGLTVTRLKGGDPFIFGRGGEEAAWLTAHGISFEIVPGISSAYAVPAYAGIPVTQRGMASCFSVITGNEDPTKEETDLDWSVIARNPGTSVFLMGLGNLAKIMDKLMAEGVIPETPVALIRQGTLADQETLIGTIADIAEKSKAADFKSPVLIVVGAVVKLRDQLSWYERKALFGKRIVVTRAREQASQFSEKLLAAGAEVINFPVISIEEPVDYQPLDLAIRQLDSYQWLVFTSVNGVDYFLRRYFALGYDIRDLRGLKLGAIGPVTKLTLEKRGLKVDLMPDTYRAEAVADQLIEKSNPGDLVLLPRADLARSLLPEALIAAGLSVDDLTVYRTVSSQAETTILLRLLEEEKISMITFTSSSTVRNLIDLIGPAKTALLDGIALASIGPITTATAEELGLKITVEAKEYTISGLMEAILDHYRA